MMKNELYNQLYKQGVEILQNAGVPEPEADTRYLLEQLMGGGDAAVRVVQAGAWWYSTTDTVPANPDSGDAWSGEAFEKFQNWLHERCSGKPIQYIVGKWHFMGLDMIVNPHVLIPRYDTEILIEQAMHCAGRLEDRERFRLMDMCTGSGCIAIAMAHFFREFTGKQGECHVVGVDISKEALKVAEENVALNNLSDRITFVESDLFQNIPHRESYHMIISNPPYIPTREISGLMGEVKNHEPRLALDGAEDGLIFYREMIPKAKEYLMKDGWLLFEIGCDQGNAVQSMFERAGYDEIKVVKDLAGLDRVVLGKNHL